MKKKIQLLLLISIVAIKSNGQSYRITFESGIANYNLDQIRNVEIINSNSSFEVTEKIANQINQSVNLDFILDDNTLLGVNLSFNKYTSQKTNLFESEEYKLNTAVNGIQFGIESEYILNLASKTHLNFNFKTGIVSSTIDIEGYINGNKQAHSAMDYLTNGFSYYKDQQLPYNYNQTIEKLSKSRILETSYFIEPNIAVSYSITKRILMKTGLAYNLNTSYLDLNFANWSGTRYKIGISYIL